MATRRVTRVLRSPMVPIFVDLARAARVDVSDLLERFGLSEAALGREVELPLDAARSLVESLAERIGDPFLGLHAAVAIPRGRYGLLEFCIRNSPTMRQGFLRLVRYIGLANELVVYTLEERDGEAIVGLRIPGEPLCLGRHANESAIALVVRIVRESLRRLEWAPRRVWFCHPAPPDVSELCAFFGVPAIEFGHGFNGFAFPAAELMGAVPSSDPALDVFLDEQAQAAIASSHATAGDPVWARIREQVRLALHDGSPRLSQVARALQMSERTLQRRLDERGTSFHRVVDDVRRELALAYLERPGVSVSEAAFMLGFSDLRAFTRAFKRWTGTTPSQHRAGAKIS